MDGCGANTDKIYREPIVKNFEWNERACRGIQKTSYEC
jgi:hypothetical protein